MITFLYILSAGVFGFMVAAFLFASDDEWEDEEWDGDVVIVTRCKDCKWFNEPGCAIEIVDDTDRPTGNDYCSFANRRE